MGRRSIADHLFEEYASAERGEDTWLVLYDFQVVKPPTKFYDNLRRIQFLAKDGVLIQYSVFMTDDQRAAYSVRDLVRRYDGMVTLFKGEIFGQ